MKPVVGKVGFTASLEAIQFHVDVGVMFEARAQQNLQC